MGTSQLKKKALLRRIRRVVLACGSDLPDIDRLLHQIKLATSVRDYKKLFFAVNELCRSLTEGCKDNEK